MDYISQATNNKLTSYIVPPVTESITGNSFELLQKAVLTNCTREGEHWDCLIWLLASLSCTTYRHHKQNLCQIKSRTPSYLLAKLCI